MKIRTRELAGAALDWAVAKCEGVLPLIAYDSAGKDPQIMDGDLVEMECDGNVQFSPSTDWSQAGPIIEHEKINTYYTPLGWDTCRDADMLDASRTYTGKTPLEAAMRCYVASKLGDEVDVPDELTGGDHERG